MIMNFTFNRVNFKSVWLALKICLIALSFVWFFDVKAEVVNVELDNTVNSNTVINTLSKHKQLANDDYWLTLLYYHKNNWGNGYNSFVDDQRFFFSASGKFDPQQELLATITEFVKAPTSQCTFPARYKWLKSQLPELFATIEQASCNEYTLWRKDLNTETVVLVYASSQLNSPSSMYGHTFIRFDPYNVKHNSTLLSHAINFGANIPPNENGLLYAIRGLGGGYPGNFAANPYFEKIKEYNRAENRDLWEYSLNLNEQEIDRMLAHVWELRGINFDYYFFDENCALRLLELIDVARPKTKLVDEFPGVTIPIDTVRVVRDKGLVTDVNYRPSVRTHLDHQLNQLTDTQRLLAIALSEDFLVTETAKFKQLSLHEQQQVVHTSYRLIRYLSNKDERSKTVSNRSFQLLKLMSKHASIQPPEPNQPKRPDLGHATTMFEISSGEANEHAFVDFTYRASYHDLLDNKPSYDSGMSLNMGKITIRTTNGSMQLQTAQLLDITSLSPKTDYISPFSWQANIGLERQWTKQHDELVLQANGGGGITYEIAPDDLFFTMLTGRIEYNQELDTMVNLAVGLETGYLISWSSAQTLMKVGHYSFIDDISRTLYSIEHQWSMANDYGLRIHAKRSANDGIDYDEFGLSVRAYF